MKTRIHSSKLSFILVIITLFIATACHSGGSKSVEGMPNDDSKDQERGNSNKAASIGVDTVIIKMMKFNPAEIHVNKGDTIVWINQGMVEHDVTQYPDKEWTSDTLARGASWKMAIEESFDYFCSIHITMKGKVTLDP